MSRHSWSSRLALWAAVCALVLKAAVPMFAAGAANLRGVPVAEVCTVYGVALPNASLSAHAHHEHHDHAHHGEHAGHADHEDHSGHAAAAHSGDHCALTALAALSVPDLATPAIAAPHQATPDFIPERRIALRDADAAWAARLRHGPPALA